MSDNNEKIVSISGARDKEVKGKDKKTVSNEPSTYCSFCGRPNQQVVKMIKGPGVNICSECIMICVQYFILEDKIPSSEAQSILDSLWRGTGK